MLTGRLFLWSKAKESFFSNRGSVGIWLIAAICFGVVFLGIIFLLLWGRPSERKPPTVPATFKQEVREPIRPLDVPKKGPEKSEKLVQKPTPPLEDQLSEKPAPTTQKSLSPAPSGIQDVSPDDPPGKGMLSQDLKKPSSPVLSAPPQTPKVSPSPPTEKPPLVSENPKPTDNTSPPNVEKPTPALTPEASSPKEKPEGVKTETVKKNTKKMTVAAVMGNVRKGPSVKAAVLFTVARGDTLQVTGQEGNWFAVRLDDGRSGWAHRTVLSGPSTPISKKAPSRPKSGKRSVINGIRTVVTDPNHAQIIFELSGYHPPEIMVIEGETPRVVCDFFSARLAPGVKKNLSVNTGVVKRIRVGVHKGSKPKVRVVLDLNTGQNYAVEQFFFEKENYYALMVNSGK